MNKLFFTLFFSLCSFYSLKSASDASYNALTADGVEIDLNELPLECFIRARKERKKENIPSQNSKSVDPIKDLESKIANLKKSLASYEDPFITRSPVFDIEKFPILTYEYLDGENRTPWAIYPEGLWRSDFKGFSTESEAKNAPSNQEFIEKRKRLIKIELIKLTRQLNKMKALLQDALKPDSAQ